ncbi:pyruvate dehydrogenase E1 subunit alpha 1a [Lates japonicus]|uniref:Pyruvate dehydrogenase E1 subunit alpha 1a n=1 Tax=Lates japonicus TaxID=270547 RepID=A0AAD3M451_LATJO|nr:pyruvate dehydrogenase E1 subunit alpha 1a [Lates japonicus]
MSGYDWRDEGLQYYRTMQTIGGETCAVGIEAAINLTNHPDHSYMQLHLQRRDCEEIMAELTVVGNAQRKMEN